MMKSLLVLLLLSLNACAAAPATKLEAAAPGQPQAPQKVKVMSDDGKRVIAEIDPITNQIAVTTSGTWEEVANTFFAVYRNTLQFQDNRYKDLADLCIGRGKPVPGQVVPGKEIKVSKKEDKKSKG